MKKTLTIRLDPELLKAVRAIAKKEDRSISYIIGRFVKNGITKQEKK